MITLFQTIISDPCRQTDTRIYCLYIVISSSLEKLHPLLLCVEDRKQKRTVFSLSHSSMPEITHTYTPLHRPTLTRMCPIPMSTSVNRFSRMKNCIRGSSASTNLHSSHLQSFGHIHYLSLHRQDQSMCSQSDY